MKLLKSVILSVSLASPAFGADISFSVAENTGVATAAGVPLSSTYTAYIGTYSGSGLNPLTASFSAINAGFEVLTSGSFAPSGFSGYLAIGNFPFADAAGFGGKPLYAFFTNGGNENALITGFGAIPFDSAPLPFEAFINVGNAAGLTYLVGGYDPLGANLAGSGGNVVLNNVPEPSATLLGALGGVFLLRRRRI